MKRKEYTAEDFAWTRWGVSEIEAAADEMLNEKKSAYEKVKHIPAEERTFENTVYAIEASGHGMWRLHMIHLLMNVSPSKDIRDAAQRAAELIEKELVDIEYDEGVHAAVMEYEAKRETLDAESEKLLRDMLREYRRMGFELPSEKRAQVKENLKRLSELSNEFSKNINEYEDHIVVTREELDGLSDGYIAGLKREGERYLVGLDYPELNPFLENAKNSAKRKELAEKSLRKGGEENVKILEEVVELRDENARLLGYANHAEFRLEVKMAKDPRTVFGFIHDLMEKVRDGVRQELDELKAVKRRVLPKEREEVFFYDIAFLANELKKEKFSVDAQKVREYFPLETVKAGMFSVYEQLLSVRFEKISDYPVWHEDVEVYAVREREGGIISYFMFDLYPREGKYGHAAAFNIITGHIRDFSGEEYATPVACIVANFPKSSIDRPSLLGHSEVVTFLHEFGHIMHEILTVSRYRSQAGFSTAWDFVEAPSQMFEHWAWDREVLKTMSKHHETGEVLPDEMIGNMLRAKNHMIAYSTMRQMIFSLFDMELHTRGVEGELNEEYAQRVAEYTGIRLPDEQLFLAGFGHLMGYDAGYYGYMWSKVYAADMFTRFEKEGILNPATGMEYRKWILEKGSSMDEADLVQGFLGREVDNEAFLKEIGL